MWFNRNEVATFLKKMFIKTVLFLVIIGLIECGWVKFSVVMF